MSTTEADDLELTATGVPELTPLGKRIELLRMERRMSKRVLAQRAGTSRQQLWRVMTGKSELTSSLCARLSEVLEVDSRVLRESAPERGGAMHAPPFRSVVRGGRVGVRGGAPPDRGVDFHADRLCQTLEEYVAEPHGVARTFGTMPDSDDGRRLKRALLNAIEDIAESRGLKLPQTFFDLRRRVVNDER